MSQGLLASKPDRARPGLALLGRGFRPFFLLASLSATLLVAAWVAMLHGLLPSPAWLVPLWWHGHEMLFGFASAAAAGFLLTAVPNWTGAPPVTGVALAALAALWLAGRVAMALAGVLPAGLVAGLDVAFLPTLAAVLLRPILAAGQRRNYGFPVVLTVLAVANGLVHLEATHSSVGTAALGLRLAVDLVVLLVVLVGGRIVPAFTASWLDRQRIRARVRSHPLLDRLSVAAVLLVAASDLAAPRSPASGAAALLAAGLLGFRMSGWQSLHTRSDPLLWSLHLGFAWVPAGLFCVALADLLGVLPPTAGMHALTAGAFGTMILAVMTRVALGHTGRDLVAPPGIPTAYVLVSGAALLRTAGPILWPDATPAVFAASGLLFAAAFALFFVIYLPILVRPRLDGKPG